MRIGIFTIIGRGPGARLQNYALQEFLKKFFNADVQTIKKINYFYEKINIKSFFKYRPYKDMIKYIINYKSYRKWLKKEKEVQENWLEFDKNVKFTKNIMKEEYGAINKLFNNKFDYIIVGSDQVWNPYWFPNIDFLKYIDKKKRISYAASFGVNEIPLNLQYSFKNTLKNMEYISVREDAGAKIIKDLIGKEVPVVVDPTLLLTTEDWLNIAKRPDWYKKGNYIIAFFLGNISQKRQKQIDKFSKDLSAKVIYPLRDINSDWEKIGPAEFIYLIANSKAVLTDSFHGTVFSIIMKKPFFVFDREQDGLRKMNSRIETLLNLFNMNERYIINSDIIDKNILLDFSLVEEILKNKRKEAYEYLAKALNTFDENVYRKFK